MAKGVDQRLTFNRGVVDRRALARLDLSKLQLAAEIQENYEPMSLGPMALRPGLGYIGEIVDGVGDSVPCQIIPFIFSSTDTALIEITGGSVSGQMRVWSDDELLMTEATGATVANITAPLTGWTDLDESGASSSYDFPAYGLRLLGTGTTYAIREQTVSGFTPGPVHTLQITVSRGPVVVRIGSTSSGTDYVKDYSLGTGEHHISFTPSGTYYLQLRSRETYYVGVSSVAISGAAPLAIDTPYSEDDLSNLRWVQSGDVVFIAASGKKQMRIERRPNNSWSVVYYEPHDGPFRVQNVTPTTITASALSGSVTLTASTPIFEQGHAGALFRLQSVGQNVTAAISAQNTFTNAIRVTGVDASRVVGIVISGTFTATVTLQRSFDEASWEDVGTYAAGTHSYDDGLDNQIIFYRIGVKTGGYTSGTANVTLNYSLGTITGVVLVTSVTNSTTATASVLSPLGSTAATDNWSEGSWSALRGYPSATDIHDGRLWWAGKDKFIGSVTDAYDSFDPDYEGDAGPIQRSIGSGPIDTIYWLMSLARLMAGTASAEVSCRSSSFDEPLTPTNFTPKIAGTQGCANVQAVRIDNRGVFAQRCGTKLYELAYSIETQDYSEQDLTIMCPRFLAPGVAGIAVQRQPDTRIHVWRTDGTVAVCVFDPSEQLTAWYDIVTDGMVERVAVLPGEDEDAVYYVVNRTIEGAQRRYLERFALRSECVGGTLNKQLDSFITFSDTSTPTAAHLAGETVRVWADGGYVDEFTADTNGQVILPQTYTSGVMGLYYEGRFKSTKLAYTVPPGKSALGARKKIGQVGLVLQDVHPDGISFGPDFTTMDGLPRIRQGAPIGTAVIEDYEESLESFPGGWYTDSRLCLKTEAPFPCTVMAAVIDMEANAK